jgi:uncharacterized membrane protein YqaE (UPF0057 family)
MTRFMGILSRFFMPTLLANKKAALVGSRAPGAIAAALLSILCAAACLIFDSILNTKQRGAWQARLAQLSRAVCRFLFGQGRKGQQGLKVLQRRRGLFALLFINAPALLFLTILAWLTGTVHAGWEKAAVGLGGSPWRVVEMQGGAAGSTEVSRLLLGQTTFPTIRGEWIAGFYGFLLLATAVWGIVERFKRKDAEQVRRIEPQPLEVRQVSNICETHAREIHSIREIIPTLATKDEVFKLANQFNEKGSERAIGIHKRIDALMQSEAATSERAESTKQQVEAMRRDITEVLKLAMKGASK